jgi:hypothetical protein
MGRTGLDRMVLSWRSRGAGPDECSGLAGLPRTPIFAFADLSRSHLLRWRKVGEASSLCALSTSKPRRFAYIAEGVCLRRQGFLCINRSLSDSGSDRLSLLKFIKLLSYSVCDWFNSGETCRRSSQSRNLD